MACPASKLLLLMVSSSALSWLRLVVPFKLLTLFFQSVLTIPIPNTDNTTRTFNLSNESYYLLLAFGDLEADTGNIAFHKAYVASGETVDLGSFGSVATAGHTLIAIHAGIVFIHFPKLFLSWSDHCLAVLRKPWHFHCQILQGCV